jgi:hypothetical protein
MGAPGRPGAGRVRQRADWLAEYKPAVYDVAGADDRTWELLSWLAGALLHGRVVLVHRGITDVIGNRIIPVSDAPRTGSAARPRMPP